MENYQDQLLENKINLNSVIVNPQLAFNYASLNHIGQKLVNMKRRDDLLKGIREMREVLDGDCDFR